MKNKLVGIFVCMLMMATTISSVAGFVNNNENVTETQTQVESEPQYSATSRDDDWPMYKYDAQGTGYINLTGPQNPTVKWKHYFGGWEAYLTPIIADGKVYMGSDNEVFYCFDAQYELSLLD